MLLLNANLAGYEVSRTPCREYSLTKSIGAENVLPLSLLLVKNGSVEFHSLSQVTYTLFPWVLMAGSAGIVPVQLLAVFEIRLPEMSAALLKVVPPSTLFANITFDEHSGGWFWLIVKKQSVSSDQTA